MQERSVGDSRFGQRRRGKEAGWVTPRVWSVAGGTPTARVRRTRASKALRRAERTSRANPSAARPGHPPDRRPPSARSREKEDARLEVSDFDMASRNALPQGERVKFHNVEPRTREERMAMNDKDALEKLRLEHRKGGNYKHVSSDNVIQPPAESAAYMSEADRFGTDAAAEEYNRRQQKKLEREVRLVTRDISYPRRPSPSERARRALDPIPRLVSFMARVSIVRRTERAPDSVLARRIPSRSRIEPALTPQRHNTLPSVHRIGSNASARTTTRARRRGGSGCTTSSSPRTSSSRS